MHYKELVYIGGKSSVLSVGSLKQLLTAHHFFNAYVQDFKMFGEFQRKSNGEGRSCTKYKIVSQFCV